MSDKEWKKVDSITFTQELVLEGSWGSRRQGAHESTMDLWINQGTERRGYIEWDIPALDRGEEIGLWFDANNELVDYDGVFSLPVEAIQLMEKNGIKVGEDFR